MIENGQLITYRLDDRNVWEVGRPSKGNLPDIKLHSLTISRRHGRFHNMDGVWFYIDYNGKNGTVYNKRHITPGKNGRVKPLMVSDGDVFIFGGGEKPVISSKTAWALFSTEEYKGEWSVADTKDYSCLTAKDEEKVTRIEHPQKGEVVRTSRGMAIYMGDVTYILGEINVSGEK